MLKRALLRGLQFGTPALALTAFHRAHTEAAPAHIGVRDPTLHIALRSLERNGYASFDGPILRELLKGFGATDEDLDDFVTFYDHGLGQDEVYSFRHSTQTRLLFDEKRDIHRLERAPFKQPGGGEENALLKDKVRHFPQAGPKFMESTATRAIWRMMRQIIKARGTENAPYVSGFHQFRIVNKAVDPEEYCPEGAQKDSPTPEGVHQDGAEMVLIMFVGGKNLSPRAGETRVYDSSQPAGVLDREKSLLAQRTTRLLEHSMHTPFEAIILDDRRVKHDNKAITAADPSKNSHRDVLVMWLRQPNDADNEYRNAHPDHPVKLTDFPEDTLLGSAQVLRNISKGSS